MSRGGARAAPGMRWRPSFLSSPDGGVGGTRVGTEVSESYGGPRAVWMKALDVYY